jgi:hypothetical protein
MAKRAARNSSRSQGDEAGLGKAAIVLATRVPDENCDSVEPA